MSHQLKIDPRDIRVFHVEHKETFAVQIDAQRNVIAWASAKVHPKDQFCRKTGYIKAVGRLHSVRLRNILDRDQKFEDFREDMIFDVQASLADIEAETFANQFTD